MGMYHKIITKLTVNLVATGSMKIVQPVTVENFIDTDNILIRSNGEPISCRQAGNHTLVQAGEFLFIPSGKFIHITHGSTQAINVDHTGFVNNRAKYLQKIGEEVTNLPFESFSYVLFNARAAEVINLFSLLSVGALGISNNKKLENLFNGILMEAKSQEVGKDYVLPLSTELLAIELMRHCYNHGLVPDKVGLCDAHLEDLRFMKMINFIHSNLSKDLSNSQLAAITRISEDYMGQYFKALAGTSPQEYIESQRLEQAVKLLRSTLKSIHAISQEAGFKDVAYFCRRFKRKFGVQAHRMRMPKY